jgi:uncharacterized membrane protein HdeD (DUF308 family)
MLADALTRSWWLILIRGLCAVAFGILAFAWPGITLLTLVLLYGAYAIADGIIALIAAFKGKGADSRWWLAIVGLLGIAAGAMAFAFPRGARPEPEMANTN